MMLDLTDSSTLMACQLVESYFMPQGLDGWLVGRLFCFMAYQPFSGYLTPN